MKWSKGTPWALAPVALLGTMLVGWGYMISLAVDDPSFSVEADYYEKAVNWEARQAQEAQNARLGWKLSVAPVVLDGSGRGVIEATLVDANGKPVREAQLRLEGFHNARGQRILKAELTPLGDGRHRVTLELQRPGVWELRFRAERGAEVFTSRQRVEVEPESVASAEAPR